MKKSMRVFLAVALSGLSGLVLSGAPAAETKAKEPPVPGSAVEPPRTVDSPLPPPSTRQQANMHLGIWIKEDGLVDAVDFIKGSKEWRDAAIATVKKWRFEPVMWQGSAIPARAEVVFNQASPKIITSSLSPLPNLPDEIHTEEEWGLTKPVIETDPDLILPLMIRSRRMLNIEAGLNYVITEDGTTDKIDLWGASSEGAVRVALDLISERKYKPAKVRELPVRMQCRQILNFQSLEKPIDALAGAVEIVDPAYPYERMLAGEEGYAVVKFTLTSEGKVESSMLLEASHPDFGGALVAAVESWQFKPEAAGESGAVREYRHDFVLNQTPYASRRLIAGVRAGEVVSNSSAGLDAKPKILARPGLAYPTAFYSEKVSGSAEVEFIVDRVGLAQLPRVLKATKPEFGWAAVTLVNGMRFNPITRGGKPAELRVRLPVQFTPPKPEAPKAGG